MTSIDTHIICNTILFVVYIIAFFGCEYVVYRKRLKVGLIGCALCFEKAVRAGFVALVSYLYKLEYIDAYSYNYFVVLIKNLYDFAFATTLLVGAVMCWRLMSKKSSH